MAYNRKLLFIKSLPSWDTPEGNLGSISTNQAMTPIQLVATEINEPGSTITYAITAGALPTGLTLSSSGEISGTPTGYTVNEDVTFIVTATDDEGESASRGFSFLVLGLYQIDYLVVAGGGGGGGASGDGWNAGGGGAGGLITSYGSTSGGGSSAESPFTVSAGSVVSITVGSGGYRGNTALTNSGSSSTAGSNGNDSILSVSGNTIAQSIGGGGGGASSGLSSAGSKTKGLNGGSGGGSGVNFDEAEQSGGLGTLNQGRNGGTGANNGSGYGAGGGGASGLGANKVLGTGGGAGLEISITGISTTYSTGGDTGRDGFDGSTDFPVANSGNGGHAVYLLTNEPFQSQSGADGIVILRMPNINYSGNTTGSPTVTTDGSDTILRYTGSGTYTT